MPNFLRPSFIRILSMISRIPLLSKCVVCLWKKTVKRRKMEKVVEKLIELYSLSSRLTIAAGKEKSPKPVGNQGLWAMVPVTGLDRQFAKGKLYGSHQFLNWWQQMPTGHLHLDRFSSGYLHKERREPERALILGAVKQFKSELRSSSDASPAPAGRG